MMDANAKPGFVSTKRITDATHGCCEDCGVTILPSLYWSLSKTIYMHKTGYPGPHRVTLYTWTPDATLT